MFLQRVLDPARPAADAWLEEARSSRVVLRRDLPDLLAAWQDALDRSVAGPGAVVGVSGHDPLSMAIAWLGVLAAGRCVAPVAPDLPVGRLARWRADVSPVLELDAAAGPEAVPAGRARTGAGGGGVLLTSSGTTGPPKLVRLTEAQLLHTAESVVSAHRLTAADRGFCPLPLHHINAEVVGLLATLLSGGTLVLDARFHRTGAWELLAEREITWLNAVPAILALLLRGEPAPAPLPRLRFVRSASAPLPTPVREGFEARTGLSVIETYGMTEAGSQITANDLDDPVPGSVGRPVGVELRVVGAPAGEVGRVQIRGGGVVTAYASAVGRDASAVGRDAFTPDGWLDTGDLGRLDPSGALFLAGRADDVINRGGEKVFPRRVEDVLLADPEVLHAAVVGWPDEVLGQVPVAAVVLATGADRDAVVARLTESCSAVLDRPERPVRYDLLEDLPTGVNGKVSRKAVLGGLVALQPAATG